MPSLPKVGPYTQAELLAFMKTLVDGAYLQPLLEQGEGAGLEVYTQINAQLARVSEAIDRTLQAMFILPWSGQSDSPALGGAKATVVLDVTRSTSGSLPVTLPVGLLVEELTTDYGTDGSVEVLTGRRYATGSEVTLLPGVQTQQVACEAEREGYGFNNPLPGTITSLVQVGAGLFNDRATVVPGTYLHKLVAWPSPNVFVPEHVGQYVQFTSGSNAGQVRRVMGYERATSSHGGIALLAKTAILKANGSGFTQGELVTIGATTTAVFVAGDATSLVVERVDGPIAVLDPVVGLSSGGTTAIVAIDQDPELLAETATAGWKVLPWEDLGISVTNVESPTGGRTSVLDELGAERGIFRSPGETDESYRQRVAKLPDIISPNAIRRICNRVLAQYGLGACLREVGLELLRGLLYDGDPTSSDPAVSYAYDMDHITVTGVATGTFFEGELVTQTNPLNGRVAQARICMTPPPSPSPTGIVDVQGTFVVGTDIVGSVSGATLSVIALTGGLRPEDRFKLVLDYQEFRAFFLIGLPPMNLGDFGFAYDYGGSNAYDLTGSYMTFYDGYAITAAQLSRVIWNAVDKAKAAGVGFDLYVERLGCF